jgi:hypothetical protein
VRAGFPKYVPVRFARLADGVVITGFAVSETVKDDQQGGGYVHDFNELFGML